jgi:hypothetical protein
MNNCDFLNFIIYVRGGQSNFWPRAPKIQQRHKDYAWHAVTFRDSAFYLYSVQQNFDVRD